MATAPSPLQGNMTEEETAEETESVVGVSGGNSRVGFPVDDIRERLNQKDVGIALLLVMTRAERVTSELLRHRYDVSHDKFQALHGRESLSWYVEKCNVPRIDRKRV